MLSYKYQLPLTTVMAVAAA